MRILRLKGGEIIKERIWGVCFFWQGKRGRGVMSRSMALYKCLL